MLSQQSLAEIDREIDKYPAESKQAAVMAALRIAQEEHGWLRRELMDYLAQQLGLEPIQVYEVATFYGMYDLEPVGRHKICVCTNVSCMLCGSDQIVAHLHQKLGISFGETTADGKYSLHEVECLCACGGAPVVQLGKDYHENMTPQKIDTLLESLQ